MSEIIYFTKVSSVDFLNVVSKIKQQVSDELYDIIKTYIKITPTQTASTNEELPMFIDVYINPIISEEHENSIYTNELLKSLDRVIENFQIVTLSVSTFPVTTNINFSMINSFIPTNQYSVYKLFELNTQQTQDWISLNLETMDESHANQWNFILNATDNNVKKLF